MNTHTHIQRNKSERNAPYDFTFMWNLLRKTNEQRKKKEERESEIKKKTLNSGEQTDRSQRGGGWGDK